jgi:hypothetical protein
MLNPGLEAVPDCIFLRNVKLTEREDARLAKSEKDSIPDSKTAAAHSPDI